MEGPEQSELYPSSQGEILYELVDPESDKEIKQEVRCLKTNTSEFVIGDSLARISEWPKVVKCVARQTLFWQIHSNMTKKIVTLNVLDGMIVDFGRTWRHWKKLRNLLSKRCRENLIKKKFNAFRREYQYQRTAR